jgi:hypothetical protein
VRIRHLALAVIGVAIATVIFQAVAGSPGGPPPVLDDGTINVTASEDGRGAWVPYTLTVRNLGDHDFTGRVLLEKLAAPASGRPTVFVVPGVGSLISPVSPGRQLSLPDAAYQFSVALSPRHKQSYDFYAPDDFVGVVVEDGFGRQVAEGEVDDRKSVAVGALTDSTTLAAKLEAIRIGDYTARVSSWDAATPMPSQALYLSGFTAVVVDHFDSGRLGKAQLATLAAFVGLGGQLILAGGSGLVPVLRGLPTELVPFAASGATAQESLAPVADLARLGADLTATVARGTLAAGATVVLESADGQPLEVEGRYGAGRVLELLFDPDTITGGAPGSADALASLALTQAVGRGLESIPGADTAGSTLLDAAQLPEVLFPRPTDAPVPPLWLVAGLVFLYLFLAVPMNYLLLSRIGMRTLFWATAPALAVLFSAAAFLIGQLLQVGIHDQEFQFYKVGPDGIASRVDVHGIVFPTRGSHRLTFGSDQLVAPYSVAFPDLTPSCSSCTFPAGSSGPGVEEHVLGGASPTILERGLVYGSVRVVASASSGLGALQLTAHLASADDRITGTIANTGKVPVSGLLVYTYYKGGYRSAVLAEGLAVGSEVQVDQMPQPIGDAAPTLPPGAVLTGSQQISLVADETGRRSLTHSGEVVIVGFVKPVDSRLGVDGLSPGGQVMAAFAMPVELESASGRLGEVAVSRLAGFYPETATGLFRDTYDVELPAVSGPLILRYDQRLYSDVEVYDWQARTWRAGPFSQDPASSIVQLAQLDPGEVHDGLVRVRLHEISLSWGAEITVRFPGESP